MMFSTWISIVVFVVCLIIFLAILSFVWFGSEDLECKFVQVKKLSTVKLDFCLTKEQKSFEFHPKFLSALHRVEDKVNNNLPIIQLEVFKEHDIYAILSEISYNVKEAVNSLPSSKSKNKLVELVFGMANPDENCCKLTKINPKEISVIWKSNGIKINISIEGEFSIY